MGTVNIPVCEPSLGGQEIKNVVDALQTGWISGSGGAYIKRFEEAFAKYCGCKYGISTTSGTTALHLAMASLGIGPGDEVIVPDFTNIATALCVVYTGATPVFVDAEWGTWCINSRKIQEKITKTTKAIIPVHIYGHPCNMDIINRIAVRHHLFVVEDAAEAHGAKDSGVITGRMGDIGCFSFYANKIITTGEGGMLTTNNSEIAEKARLLRNLAFTERRYLHPEIGFNYRMTNLQAAVGCGQLERLDQFISIKRDNAHQYNQQLKDVDGITTPIEMPWAKNVYWMYGIVVAPTYPLTRDELMIQLKQDGVDTRAFFMGMHQQPAFINHGIDCSGAYPVSDMLAKRGLYLPSSVTLTLEEIGYVCGKIGAYAENLS